MSDLVERLRAKPYRPTREVNLGNGATVESFGFGYSSEDYALRIEAANSIEELAAKVKELEDFDGVMSRELFDNHKTINDLAAQNVALQNALICRVGWTKAYAESKAWTHENAPLIWTGIDYANKVLDALDIATPVINRVKAEALREAATALNNGSHRRDGNCCADELRRMADEQDKT